MTQRLRLAAGAALLLSLGCDGCERGAASAEAAPPAPPAVPATTSERVAPPASSAVPEAGPALAASELTWRWDSTPVGRMQVVVRLPARRAGQRFPVLIAMHGRGEALKGPEKGARGWVDDYWLPRAIDRLHRPPLRTADLLELGDADRIARMNEALGQQPYRGLVVVCPYTPDILAGDRPFSAALALARFLVDELLPRVRKETPALAAPESTGIDGVSLGGRASLLVGLERPEAFGVVAGLQAAFDSADAPELARRARQAREKNPSLVLRLLSSEGDFFLNPTRAISRALTAEGVAHVLTVIPGPHDYEFNRGPGAFEMLFFHDRALRREPGLDPVR